jgi:hypothetical protein
MVKQEELFKIGDYIWYAQTRKTAEHIPCPVCYGKKEVTVVLGNGEEILTPCRWCQSGFEESRGWVEGNYKWEANADLAKVTSMRQEVDEFGELKVTYYCSGNGHYHDYCAATKEEALAKSLAQAQEWQAREDAEKIEFRKKYGYRDYSYNAGYHRREAERCYDTYLYHLKHAHHFEEKARPRDALDKKK